MENVCFGGFFQKCINYLEKCFILTCPIKTQTTCTNILIIAHKFIPAVIFLFRSGLLLIASAQEVGPVVKTIVPR